MEGAHAGMFITGVVHNFEFIPCSRSRRSLATGATLQQIGPAAELALLPQLNVGMEGARSGVFVAGVVHDRHATVML